MVVNDPPDVPYTKMFRQPDGNARALIQVAARWATEIIAPFRVANTDFSDALAGDSQALARSKAAALTGLTQPWDPTMTGATEIVLLRNLLAIIAMIDGDRTDATKHFTLAAAVPGAEPAGYGLLLLNQAFFAIADKRPEEARRLFQEGEKAVQSVVSPGFHGRIMVLKGLVAWANGDKTEAEQLFRHAVAKAYDDDEAHRYLAILLAEHGASAEAAIHREIAKVARGTDKHFPSLAHTFLKVDPVAGGFVRTF